MNINIFEFDQIDFNLDDLSSRTITVPKVQEIDTITLLNCFDVFSDYKKIETMTYDCKKIIPEIKTNLPQLL